MGAHHILQADAGTVHRGTFDAAIKPVFTIASGDTVEITSLSDDLADLPDAQSGFTVSTEHRNVLRGLVNHAGLLSFQISIGTMPAGNKLGLAAREIDDRDVPSAKLVFGQLRERNLPVATAVFAEHVIHKLEAMVSEPRPVHRKS